MNSFVNLSLPVPVSCQTQELMLPRPPATDSWEYWLPRWIARKATTTRKIYAEEIKKFLDFIGWKAPSLLLTTDIEDWQQLAVKQGLKPNTVGRKTATICSLCTFIHRRDLRVMPQNVGAGVERVKASNDLANRILSETEVLRMFDRTTRPRDLALLRVLYGAGLRIAEAVELRWKDIVWRENDALLTVLGKGSKIRTVAIYNHTLEALRAIMPPGEVDPSAFVFQTVHGQLCRVYSVQIIRKAAKRAGIKKAVSPHWLRHSSATHALERKCPLPLVCATLGHANLAVTGRYLHVRPGESMGKFHAL